jgi:4-diphosphocytidyl-2-C-methyl-D-erythritol kinase
MLVFPNCKINLGLYVTEKRHDGFHNVETVFYPVNWTDALEVLENTRPGAQPFTLHWPNQSIDIPLENQLLYKAWKLVNGLKSLPPVSAYFLKTIPFGAGLGGGSSDAAQMILLLDKKFDLQLSIKEKLKLASSLGSDCSFFIENKPQVAKGRGELLSPCSVDLSAYFILLVYPNIHCDTALAYKTVQPQTGRKSIQSIVEHKDLSVWKNELVNDFEQSVFEKHTAIGTLKNRLYDLGALYASMSGSGSTVFGLFKSKPDLEAFSTFRTHLQEPIKKVF